MNAKDVSMYTHTREHDNCHVNVWKNYTSVYLTNMAAMTKFGDKNLRIR